MRNIARLLLVVCVGSFSLFSKYANASSVTITGDNYGNACSGRAICIIGPPLPQVTITSATEPTQIAQGQYSVVVEFTVESYYRPNNLLVLVQGDAVKSLKLVCCQSSMNVEEGEWQKGVRFLIFDSPNGLYRVEIDTTDPIQKPGIALVLNAIRNGLQVQIPH